MELMSISQIEADLIDGIGDKAALLMELTDRANAGIKASKGLRRLGRAWVADAEKIDQTAARVKAIIDQFQ